MIALNQNGAGSSAPRDDFLHYLGVLRRYWWLIAGAGFLAAAAGWWLESRKPEMYTAEGLLQHVTDVPVVPVGFGGGAGTEFGVHLDILRSPAFLTTVVDSTAFQLRLRDREADRSSLVRALTADPNPLGAAYSLSEEGGQHILAYERTGDLVSTTAIGLPIMGPGFELSLVEGADLSEPLEFSLLNKDIAIEILQRRLRIEQGTGASLIWIRYRDADPISVASMVNTVGSLYQRHRASGAQSAAGRRQDVIYEQLVNLSDSLRVAEGLLLDYQRDARLLDPSTEGNALVSAVFVAENEVRTLRYQEGLLQSLVTGLERGSNEESMQQILALGGELIPAGANLAGRLQDLQLERSRLTASAFGLSAGDPQVQVVDSLIANTRGQIEIAAQQSLDLLRSNLRAATSRYNQLSGEVGEMPGRAAELTRLSRRVDVIQSAYDQLVEKYFEAQIAEGVEAGDIEIVGPAPVPARPDPSRLPLNVSLALLVGLGVGVVGAFGLDQLDKSIRRARDAEAATGLQVIGSIPRVRSTASPSASLYLGKEAFRTLRTHLRFAQSGRSRLIAVTSATPRDGKTTVSGNLALTLAEQGRRTLLIDADLRRPQVHLTYGLPRSPGLSDVLAGSKGIEESVSVYPGNEFLDVLPAGSPVDNATELIGGQRFADLLSALGGTYDSVVLDTPPLLAVSDAALIGAIVDGTVIVARAHRTNQDALGSAVDMLRRLSVPILGLVLNDVAVGDPGYSYYPSYHNYDEGENGKQLKRERRFLLRGKHVQVEDDTDLEPEAVEDLS